MLGGGGPRGGGGGAGAWGKKPIKPDTVKRGVGTFKPYGVFVGWVVATVLASAIIGSMPPFFLRSIVNRGLIGHDLNTVVYYTLYSLVATLASTAPALAYGYLSVLVGQRIMRDLRNQLYDHLQGMSLKFFTSTRTGEMQSRLANDVSGVQGVLSDTLANVLSNIAIVLSALAVMITLDWRLTLLSIGVLPIFAGIAGKVGGAMRGIRSQAQSQLADMNSTMQETLSVSGMLLTKTSGRRALALRRFTAENEALTGTSIKQSMIMRYFFNLIGLSFSITPVLVYWLAGYLIIGRHDLSLNLGTIVGFTAAQSRLFFPLTGLLNAQVEVTGALALFDRIFEYLDLKQDIVDSPDAIAIDPHQVKGAVGFKDVTFRYDASQQSPTLDGITFDAKPGSLVALVGPSGAGKTTMTYLIPRLYDVDSGLITIDGTDTRKIKLESLGRMIGVVTQETYLVHDSIRENLRYGRPEATDDELVAAAKAAAIHDHIASLPEGYETIVGERGYKLSGGEKQRIAIARAILKDPRILILDEATSSLDTQSERLIQSALVPLMSGRTTFAVAHRLSTILAADIILVISGGRIAEQGTHASLLAADGAYARLYEAQFQNEMEDNAPAK